MKEVLIIEDHPFVAEATKALIAKIHPDLNASVCNAAVTAVSLLCDPRPQPLGSLININRELAAGLMARA